MRKYLYNLATDKSRGWVAWLIKLILFVLSLIYGLTIRAIILVFSMIKCSLPAKVISVGNITLGGTGKTPLVEYLASLLKEKGRSVVILTRGYGSGEEARMLEENLEGLPVIVDSDRIKGGRRAIKEYFADTLILDDGFQQWRLVKNLDIAVIDASNPFGNRNMLPRGILREPLSSLKRADIFMLTKTDMAADLNKLKVYLQRLNNRAEIFDSVHKPVNLYRLDKKAESLPLGFLKGKTVAIFCGIGDPESFGSLIRSAGAEVAAFCKYPDHHDYTDADLESIISGAKEKNIGTIITTEKDAARIINSGLNDYNSSFFALRVELAIKENERFVKRLFGLYSV